MHINELISEQNQLDELSLAGVGRGLGAVAGAVGKGIGNVQGAWQGTKAAYTQNRDAASGIAARNVAHGGGAQMDKTGNVPDGTTQQAGINPTKLRQQATALNRQADEIEQTASAQSVRQVSPAQSIPAPGTSYDPAKAAADKLAAGQAAQAQAGQQMTATKQANTATSQQDAAIKAAADAAKAKVPFQQTASDKLAIKAAADKGIREAKKNKLKNKKVVAEFNSRFLGMKI